MFSMGVAGSGHATLACRRGLPACIPGYFIWDDGAHVTQNPDATGTLGFRGIWTSAAATYSPAVLTSFWIQHAIWDVVLNGGAHAVFPLGTSLRRVCRCRRCARSMSRSPLSTAPLYETQLKTDSMDDLKTYLRWHVIHAKARFLSAAYVQADFDFFSNYLRGVPAMQPRWRCCVQQQ